MINTNGNYRGKMKKIGKILLQGLVAVLPIGLTLYLIFWLIVNVEKLFRAVLTIFIPESFYLPGIGLIFGIAVLFIIGLFVNELVVQRAISYGENILEKIPVIKSVYSALRDFMDYLSSKKSKDDIKHVVLVRMNNVQLIGFVTGSTEDLAMSLNTVEKVAVYLPMSYQLGGYTVYVDQNCIEAIDMSVEDAMRHVLTAGLSKN
jgi:uncharacterized membrane protein